MQQTRRSQSRVRTRRKQQIIITRKKHIDAKTKQKEKCRYLSFLESDLSTKNWLDKNPKNKKKTFEGLTGLKNFYVWRVDIQAPYQ